MVGRAASLCGDVIKKYVKSSCTITVRYVFVYQRATPRSLLNRTNGVVVTQRLPRLLVLLNAGTDCKCCCRLRWQKGNEKLMTPVMSGADSSAKPPLQTNTKYHMHYDNLKLHTDEAPMLMTLTSFGTRLLSDSPIPDGP